MSLTRLRLSLITRAGKNRQPGVFFEARVGQRELAENEHRAAIGLNAPGMNAIQTETGLRPRFRILRALVHGFIIIGEILVCLTIVIRNLNTKSFGTVTHPVF
jgi:hypothetical protein